MLQDLVLAAIRDGLERANDMTHQALGGADPTAALGGLFGALGAEPLANPFAALAGGSQGGTLGAETHEPEDEDDDPDRSAR
jgi:hypothetical protein